MAETREQLREQLARARFPSHTVHSAAEVGDIPALERAVHQGMINGTPESVTLQQREGILGMMPIHIASEKGQLEVVQFLIKKRVDLDAGDNFRITALHLAAIENEVEVVEELLRARVTVNSPDVEGDLAIHWAATKGHAAVIKVLVRKGSHVDAANKKGWTPLHRAAYNGRKDAVAMLISLGADMGAVTGDGNTPLHLACFMNQLGVVSQLCDMGAAQSVVNARGQTPLDLCISEGARDTLTSLKGFGADDTRKHKDIRRPMAPSILLEQAHSQSQPGAQKGRVAELQDDFPSPGQSPKGSFTDAGRNVDSIFMRQALNENGVNPYGGTPQKGVGLGSSPAAVAAQPSTSSVGRTAPVLDSLPGSLTAPLRPLRAPSPGAGSPSSSSRPGQAPLQGRLSSFSQNGGLPVGPAGSGREGQAEPRSNGRASLSSSGLVQAASSEYQERARNENRRALASTEALLAPRAARPVSSNKKFLQRYGLDKKTNLFAP